MITTLLWDIDGTVLDFLAAEAAAIRSLFAEFALGPCSDAMIAHYSAVNKRYWKLLEEGRMTKGEILIGRFREFFAEEGICTDVARFNEAYQLRLGDTIVFMDGADRLLRECKAAGLRQYAVTNGTRTAQRKKLTNADLWSVFDGVFISDEIGAEKPSPAFFDHVLAAIGPVPKSEIAIIGDSLSSDMAGGMAAGLYTCWYNPRGEALPPHMRVNATITNLQQLKGLLPGWF